MAMRCTCTAWTSRTSSSWSPALRRPHDGGHLHGPAPWASSTNEQGTGVLKDATKAVALYQKACDGGTMRGCNNLGVLYEQGTGAVKDATKAAALYQKGA
jgi:hypothetical protein